MAAIDFDTCMLSDTVVEDVKEKVKWAPRIMGSEGDAQVFINLLDGHNVSAGRGDDGEIQYYQTRVVITVLGDLRDREKDKTEEEWNRFLRYVEDELDGIVRNVSCNIEEG